MKVSLVPLQNPTLSIVKPQDAPSPTEQKALQSALAAEALAKAALNQLYFAGTGGDVLYLQNVKQLAEQAGLEASSISLPSALSAAKGAHSSALYALHQAAKLEALESSETSESKLSLLA